MTRTVFAIAAVLVVAAFVGMSIAPAASATRYDFDFTKVVKGYTLHVFGFVDIDKQAKTVSGEIHITVTNPAGTVIFDKMYTFSFTYTSAPRPITLWLPGVGIVKITFPSAGGIAVTTDPILVRA